MNNTSPIPATELMIQQALKANEMLKAGMAEIQKYRRQREEGADFELISASEWIGLPLDEAIIAQGQLKNLSQQSSDGNIDSDSLKELIHAHQDLALTLSLFLSEIKDRFWQGPD